MPETHRDEIVELFPTLASDTGTYGPTAFRSLKSYEGRLLA